MSRIVIAGGSGELGQLIAVEALRQAPGAEVVIGDYRPDRGARIAARLGAAAAQLDLSDDRTIRSAIRGADLVLVAAGQAEPNVQRACHQHRIPCVDVTTDSRLIARISELDADLRAAGLASVVMAGLFPGLSGLLAMRAAADLTQVAGVDVALRQHTNARAGRGGIADMLTLITAPVRRGHSIEAGFGRRFDGAPSLRVIDSPERAVLAEALGTARVDYWTGWNDPGFTALIAGLVRIGVLPRLAPQLASLQRHRPQDPEPVELRVRVTGWRGGARARSAWALTADSDYGATARAAVGIGLGLLGGSPGGVHTPVSLTTLDELVDSGVTGMSMHPLGDRPGAPFTA